MDVRYHEPNAATFFNEFVETFDTIYDPKRNVFMRWVDCMFRSDMFIRYALTFEVLGRVMSVEARNGFYMSIIANLLLDPDALWID